MMIIPAHISANSNFYPIVLSPRRISDPLLLDVDIRRFALILYGIGPGSIQEIWMHFRLEKSLSYVQRYHNVLDRS